MYCVIDQLEFMEAMENNSIPPEMYRNLVNMLQDLNIEVDDEFTHLGEIAQA